MSIIVNSTKISSYIHNGVDCSKVYARKTSSDDWVLVFKKEDGTVEMRFLIGNHKMNLKPSTIQTWLDSVYANLNDKAKAGGGNVNVLIAPQALNMQSVANSMYNKGLNWYCALQFVCSELKGAYTGQNSVEAFSDFGKFAFVGQVETRNYLGVTDEKCNAQILTCVKNGIIPILFVGDDLYDRQSGAYKYTVPQQILRAFKDVDASIIRDCVICYEPIWAIGTGQVISVAQVQEMHKLIREMLFTEYGGLVSTNIHIIFGGSANLNNAPELLAQPDVDGFCVGGLSLKADFGQLVNLMYN